MNFGSFNLFLIFYLIFKLNFYLKKSQKRGYLRAGADVASGEGSELTRDARDHRADATRL